MFGNEAQFSKGENHKTTRENGVRRSRRVVLPFLLKVFHFVSPFLIFIFLFPSLLASISYALTKLIIVTEERLVESNLFIDGSAIR